MFGIGTGELLLILVIALLVLGPERMPRVARDLGKVVGDLRRASDELRDEFLNADRVLDRAASAGTPPASATSSSSGTPASTAEAPAVETGSAPEGETPFDREMREARERLRAHMGG